ncbi:MAG TPA: macro domain-containing protein [Clostridia bacterium]|nr:macro domain-containing protein [Clostridia bacterium]
MKVVISGGTGGGTGVTVKEVTEDVTDGILLECVRGDITAQTGFDAVVNAANAELRPGGGVAGAIHRAAGPGLDKECRAFAPIETGQAVITGGHNLPNPYVIHVLGPVFGREKDPAKKLAEAYTNALRRAEEKGLTSVAFPAISTGAFGYPVKEAAEIAFRTIINAAGELKSVRRIRFVLYSERDLAVHEEVLRKLVQS